MFDPNLAYPDLTESQVAEILLAWRSWTAPNFYYESPSLISFTGGYLALHESHAALLAACKAVLPLVAYRYEHGNDIDFDGDNDGPYAMLVAAIALAERGEAVA